MKFHAYTKEDLEWVRQQGLDPKDIAYDGLKYNKRKKVLRGYHFTGLREVGGNKTREAFSLHVETPPPWTEKTSK